MIEVARIPVLSDNYVWLVHEPVSGETAVVDPAVAEQVLAEAERRGWTISQIWNTHWHPDHTGGNAALKRATGATVTAPAAEAARIPTLDRAVAEGAARETTDTLMVRCHLEGTPGPLPQRVEATLLRVAQGALANVREHAAA